MPPAHRTQLRLTDARLIRRLASCGFGLDVLGLASRAAVVLLFLLGMLVPASAARFQSANNVSVEETEERAPVETIHIHVNASRRQHLGLGPSTRDIEHPRTPRALHPRRPAPPRPNWQCPRRSVPPDDDDDDDSLA